jgi:hypothetical protein
MKGACCDINTDEAEAARSRKALEVIVEVSSLEATVGVEGVEAEVVIMVIVTTVGAEGDIICALEEEVVMSESERRLLRCRGVSVVTEEAAVEDSETEEEEAEDKETALALRCCSVAEAEVEGISRGPSPRLSPRFISIEGPPWLASLGAWCSIACCCCCCWN